jgi:superfamily II DNA or RNA helicase
MTNIFERLSFRHPFRKYQRMILEQVATQQTDNKYHIVAPPGAGKTILGLELIRQFGTPAVVFAPTTTIQAQWYEKVGMFLDPVDPADKISDVACMDPDQCAPIYIFTYQLISTQAEAQEHIKESANLLWKEELVNDGQVPDLEKAEARLAALQQNNPQEYRRELAKCIKRVKHKLLYEPDVDIEPFLHPNARRLINDLIQNGVRTIVLDECHHLLDYWAIVLRYFIRRVENPKVIGLTATLPSPENDEEYENYTSLLGDIDFEVPTPAVVKEGDLAPYRDLVYIVKPTKRETEYLKRIQVEFESAIALLIQDQRFLDWAESLIQVPPEAADRGKIWQAHWDEHPLLTLAAVRFANSRGTRIPADLPVPVEATDPIQLEDWSNLLERFGLDVLKTSQDKKDHQLLNALRKAILPFGLTLTERGINQSRSAGDLVLSFSESKDYAVAHILEAELAALGERLRAIVVTDFERVGTGVPRLKGVLDTEAGSAVRAFRLLASYAPVKDLHTVLVTGKSMMVPAASWELLEKEFKGYLKAQKLKASCSSKPTKDPHILEVVGTGKDWTSRTYVRMVTALFDRGVIKCMVGTRGIFGEGWDSLTLNTLIDLTSVTTSTSVQQLRGRTIRLDPGWKEKVAHNWDVICISKEFERGDADFKRFVRRHEQYWGIVVYTDWAETLDRLKLNLHMTVSMPDPASEIPESAKGSKIHGAIVKGINHVNPNLLNDWQLAEDIRKVNFGKHNRRMIQQTRFRDKAYDLWGIGEDYSNFSYRMSSLNARDLKIRTAFTLQNTVRALFLYTLGAVAQTFLVLLLQNARPLLSTLASPLFAAIFIPSMIMVILAVTLLLHVKKIYQLSKKLFTEQNPDAILLDIARALVEALKANNLISKNLSPDYVRVIETEKHAYQVMLDYASPEDAATFIQAYEEIFEPVVDQRYLVMRTEDRLPNLPLRILWFPFRSWVRSVGMYPPAYHPVPRILASRKERVETFARYWMKYVGGGKIVFTRSELGRAILLSARAQRRPKVKQLAFEVWK